MTTVAYDGTYLVADRQTTQDNIKYTIQKIHKTPLGFAAICGHTSHALAIMHWLQDYNRSADSYPKIPAESGSVLLISPTDGVHVYGADDYRPLRITVDKYADGSGAGFALGAMYAGKSAIDAVIIASKLDCYSGHGYTMVHLKDGTITNIV